MCVSHLLANIFLENAVSKQGLFFAMLAGHFLYTRLIRGSEKRTGKQEYYSIKFFNLTRTYTHKKPMKWFFFICFARKTYAKVYLYFVNN